MDVALNGVPHSSLSVLNRALHYGDGLFESLRVVQGQPIALALHLKRLRRGAELLQFSEEAISPLPIELDRFCQGRETGILKVILTRSAEQRGYRIPDKSDNQRVLFWYPDHTLSKEQYDEGVSVCRCRTLLPNQGPIAAVKSLNRLPQVMARSEWRDEAIYEGLMFNERYDVVEGTQSNLFLIVEEKVLTPNVDNYGIAGLMRERVMTQLQQWRVPLSVVTLQESDLLRATSMFLTNSLIGILPVRQYLQQRFSSHCLVQKLQSHFHPHMALPWRA